LEDISNRGTAEELLRIKISSLVVSMLYPTVLMYCYKELGEEGAVKTIRQIGKNTMDNFLKIYKKKRNKFQDVIKDMFKIYYDNKVKVKKINNRLYHVIEDNCIVCQDIALEGLPFHYCVSNAGSIERILEHFAELGTIPKFNYHVRTIYSKGSGDKSCVYEVRLVEAK